MNATASAIYAHRHTVAYRLERVKELTGLDPLLSEDRERLGLGLKGVPDHRAAAAPVAAARDRRVGRSPLVNAFAEAVRSVRPGAGLTIPA